MKCFYVFVILALLESMSWANGPAKIVETGNSISMNPIGSILFMDHPGNFNHPSKWHAEPAMPYFSPAILFDKPYSVEAGNSLSLRYRIVVTANAMTVQEAERRWSDWTTTKR